MDPHHREEAWLNQCIALDRALACGNAPVLRDAPIRGPDKIAVLSSSNTSEATPGQASSSNENKAGAKSDRPKDWVKGLIRDGRCLSRPSKQRKPSKVKGAKTKNGNLAPHGLDQNKNDAIGVSPSASAHRRMAADHNTFSSESDEAPLAHGDGQKPNDLTVAGASGANRDSSPELVIRRPASSKPTTAQKKEGESGKQLPQEGPTIPGTEPTRKKLKPLKLVDALAAAPSTISSSKHLDGQNGSTIACKAPAEPATKKYVQKPDIKKAANVDEPATPQPDSAMKRIKPAQEVENGVITDHPKKKKKMPADAQIELLKKMTARVAPSSKRPAVNNGLQEGTNDGSSKGTAAKLPNVPPMPAALGFLNQGAFRPLSAMNTVSAPETAGASSNRSHASDGLQSCLKGSRNNEDENLKRKRKAAQERENEAEAKRVRFDSSQFPKVFDRNQNIGDPSLAAAKIQPAESESRCGVKDRYRRINPAEMLPCQPSPYAPRPSTNEPMRRHLSPPQQSYRRPESPRHQPSASKRPSFPPEVLPRRLEALWGRSTLRSIDSPIYSPASPDSHGASPRPSPTSAIRMPNGDERRRTPDPRKLTDMVAAKLCYDVRLTLPIQYSDHEDWRLVEDARRCNYKALACDREYGRRTRSPPPDPFRGQRYRDFKDIGTIDFPMRNPNLGIFSPIFDAVDTVKDIHIDNWSAMPVRTLLADNSHEAYKSRQLRFTEQATPVMSLRDCIQRNIDELSPNFSNPPSRFAEQGPFLYRTGYKICYSKETKAERRRIDQDNLRRENDVKSIEDVLRETSEDSYNVPRDDVDLPVPRTWFGPVVQHAISENNNKVLFFKMITWVNRFHDAAFETVDAQSRGDMYLFGTRKPAKIVQMSRLLLSLAVGLAHQQEFIKRFPELVRRMSEFEDRTSFHLGETRGAAEGRARVIEMHMKKRSTLTLEVMKEICELKEYEEGDWITIYNELAASYRRFEPVSELDLQTEMTDVFEGQLQVSHNRLIFHDEYKNNLKKARYGD